MEQSGAERYLTVWYGKGRYGTMWYRTVRHGTVQDGNVEHNLLPQELGTAQERAGPFTSSVHIRHARSIICMIMDDVCACVVLSIAHNELGLSVI